MATMSSAVYSAEPLRRTRRPGRKVRTGCKTCKIRRVKCDENRPFCYRCTSTGRKCDGYAQETRDLEFQAVIFHQSPSSQPSAPILSGLGENIQYLEFYHHCARPNLSSNFDNEFWSRIALQMAQSEPAIRHALIALGYLHKTEPGSLKHARSSSEAEHEHKPLLVHYNKALKSLADRMVEASYTQEIGLVTCVLFICIEYLRGNWRTAFMHMISGLKILTEWKQGRLIGSSSVSSSPQSSPESTSSVSSSLTMIEHKLIPIFIRSITAGLIYGIPIEYVYDHLPSHFEKRPFDSISEAQSSSHDLRNLSLAFSREVGLKLVVGDAILEEDLQYQNHLLECHYSWLLHLQNLERDRVLSKEDMVTASCLKVSYYSTLIIVACSTETSSMPYDEHLESFKALNYHAKIVLDSMGLASSPVVDSVPEGSNDTLTVRSRKHSPTANFTFEVSVVPPLFFCATRCRCPTTRREAISLLSLNPPREGLWDPKQVVVVSKRAIEIEESQVDPLTGWPVEKTRLHSVVIEGNMDGTGRFSARFSVGFDYRGVERIWEEKLWEEWFVM